MSNKKTYVVIRADDIIEIGDEFEDFGNIYYCQSKCLGYYKYQVESDTDHFKIKDENTYTEKEMQSCFNYAREVQTTTNLQLEYSYTAFSDVLNKINS